MYDKILVTGSVAYDVIMDFPSLFGNYIQPDKIHQLNVSFVVDKLEKQLGGTGTNIAYNLSLLSKKDIILLASVGKDGSEFLRFFKRHSIQMQYVITDNKLYTAAGHVITDKNDNQIWGFYYGACKLAGKIRINEKDTKNALMIISANHPDAFLHFQKEAIRLGIDYIYDPGMALTWISKKELVTGILNSKWLIGNDYEISQICKQSGLSIKDMINKRIAVITTLGKEGVRYQSLTKFFIINSFKLKKVIDPTGAGDAWRGGFIAALVEGKSIRECLVQGNVMASFAVEKYGTVNHKPTAREIERRLRNF